MSTLLRIIKNLGIYKLIALGSGLLITILLIIIYCYKVSNSNKAILYSDLDEENSQQIIQKLESLNISYELSNNGKIIKVANSQVSKIRMEMAKSGIPSRGNIIGYEIFDKEESLGTTNFLQNVKIIRALEGELSRTIESFEQINRARVHLVLPQKELFSRESQQPSASVILKIKKGKSLNKSEINSISYLLSTAVANLDVKNITIVDNLGKSLKLGGSEEIDSGHTLSNNELYRISYENRLRSSIENLLEKSIGVGHVKAEVVVEIDFDRIVTNDEIYNPDKIAVRSSQTVTNNESNPFENNDNDTDISMANNLPDKFSKSNKSNSLATVNHSEETLNYEISKTTKNHVNEIGSIKKLSIAVLVDGIYKTVNGNLEYVARSNEELVKIEQLVKTAVGFCENRQDQIQVTNMQFSQETDFVIEEQDNIKVKDWLKKELSSILKILILSILIGLIFLTTIKPILFAFISNKFTIPVDNGEQNIDEKISQKEASKDNIISNIEGNMAQTEKIAEIMKNYPEECLSVLRRWMNDKK